MVTSLPSVLLHLSQGTRVLLLSPFAPRQQMRSRRFDLFAATSDFRVIVEPIRDEKAIEVDCHSPNRTELILENVSAFLVVEYAEKCV